ncbi:MAG: hypothetical protein AAF492_05755, partial [Verrucomicrobiota bacterium]
MKIPCVLGFGCFLWGGGLNVHAADPIVGWWKGGFYEDYRIFYETPDGQLLQSGLPTKVIGRRPKVPLEQWERGTFRGGKKVKRTGQGAYVTEPPEGSSAKPVHYQLKDDGTLTSRFGDHTSTYQRGFSSPEPGDDGGLIFSNSAMTVIGYLGAVERALTIEFSFKTDERAGPLFSASGPMSWPGERFSIGFTEEGL